MNFLPDDWQDAILLGRLDLGEGPTPILVHKGEVFDVSQTAPTVSRNHTQYASGTAGSMPRRAKLFAAHTVSV